MAYHLGRPEGSCSRKPGFVAEVGAAAFDPLLPSDKIEAIVRLDPFHDILLLAEGRNPNDRGLPTHYTLYCAGHRAMTLISKSNPASQVTPRAVQFG